MTVDTGRLTYRNILSARAIRRTTTGQTQTSEIINVERRPGGKVARLQLGAYSQHHHLAMHCPPLWSLGRLCGAAALAQQRHRAIAYM